MGEKKKALLSISEASELYGVSKYFLRKAIKNKQIPAITNGGKQYLPVMSLERVLSGGVAN